MSFRRKTTGRMAFSQRTFGQHSNKPPHVVDRCLSSSLISYRVDKMSFTQMVFDQKTQNQLKPSILLTSLVDDFNPVDQFFR